MQVDLSDVRPRQQKLNESDDAYLRAALGYAKRRYESIRDTWDYKYCHVSFAVRDALLATEKRFCDLGTCGVENLAFDLDYLNTGDSYSPTIFADNGDAWRGPRFWLSHVEHEVIKLEGSDKDD